MRNPMTPDDYNLTFVFHLVIIRCRRWRTTLVYHNEDLHLFACTPYVFIVIEIEFRSPSFVVIAQNPRTLLILLPGKCPKGINVTLFMKSSSKESLCKTYSEKYFWDIRPNRTFSSTLTLQKSNEQFRCIYWQ